MKDIFIGRSSVVTQIDNLVVDTENHVLPIVAKGGVGKTWLLRNLRDRYLDLNILESIGFTQKGVCPIWVDFSEARFHNILNITLEWLNQLQGFFPSSDLISYRLKVSKLTTFVSEFNTYEELRSAEKETVDYFLSILSRISSQHRILILLDTVETSPSALLERQVSRLISKLPNTIWILAGRPKATLFKSLSTFEEFNDNHWHIHDNIKLSLFTTNDVQNYFFEALGTKLDISFCRQIRLLTAGNPVLVAITSEWLKNNVDLPEEVKISPIDTGSLSKVDLKIRQDKFKFDLLSNIRKLQNPLDWIVLYAAYLNRRSDPKIFKITIDSKDEDSFNDAFAKFNDLVFVRKSLTAESGRLHDEAERLILKYVWPIVDPDGELRVDLAQKIVDQYYTPKIAELLSAKREYLRRNIDNPEFLNEVSLQDDKMPEPYNLSKKEFQIIVLQTECLDYNFRISENEGWSYLERLIQEATIELSIVQSSFIEQAIYKLKLEEKNEIRTLIAKSRIRLIQKDNQTAESLAEDAKKLLDRKPFNFDQQPDYDDLNDEAKITMILGMTQTKSNNKISLLEDAQEKAKFTENPLLDANTYKQLGLAYRKHGNWKKAIESYDAALKLLDHKDNPDEYAAILNNLAFVLLLDGKPFPADSMAEEALHIRKQRANLHGMSLSYSTKGRIVEALGDYSRATKFYKQAANLALERNDNDFYALCQTNLATVQIIERNYNAARDLVKLGMESGNQEVKARAYHQASKIELMHGKYIKRKGNTDEANSLFEKAKIFAKEGLNIAHTIVNFPLEAAIIYELALIEYLQNNHEDKYYLDRLEKILSTYDLRLEKGRLKELKGDFKFSSGDFLKAFTFYIEACQILANYSPASFYDTFERIRSKFLNCSSNIQKEIFSHIDRSVQNTHPNDLMTAFKHISNQYYKNSPEYLSDYEN